MPFSSASPDGRLPGPRPLSRWWFLVFAVPGAMMLLVLIAPNGHGHGRFPIHVTGRLVRAGSGEGIEGARVVAVSRYDLAHHFDGEQAWADGEAVDAELATLEDDGYGEDVLFWLRFYDNAKCHTSETGHLVLRAGLRTTTTFSPLFSRTEVQDPADAVAALWIAVEGREPVVVRLDHVDWERAEVDVPDGIWDTYDLGTVPVPEGEP